MASTKYMQSLEIKKKINDIQGAAATCHQLGLVALEEKDDEYANNWLEYAIKMSLSIGDIYTVTSSYIALGNIMYTQVDYDEAEKWYIEALRAKMRIDDEI